MIFQPGSRVLPLAMILCVLGMVLGGRTALSQQTKPLSLPPGMYYSIVAGSYYKNKSDAEAVFDTLVQKLSDGALDHLEILNMSIFYLTRLGHFEDRTSAERLLSAVKKVYPGAQIAPFQDIEEIKVIRVWKDEKKVLPLEKDGETTSLTSAQQTATTTDNTLAAYSPLEDNASISTPFKNHIVNEAHAVEVPSAPEATKSIRYVPVMKPTSGMASSDSTLSEVASKQEGPSGTGASENSTSSFATALAASDRNKPIRYVPVEKTNDEAAEPSHSETVASSRAVSTPSVEAKSVAQSNESSQMDDDVSRDGHTAQVEKQKGDVSASEAKNNDQKTVDESSSSDSVMSAALAHLSPENIKAQLDQEERIAKVESSPVKRIIAGVFALGLLFIVALIFIRRDKKNEAKAFRSISPRLLTAVDQLDLDGLTALIDTAILRYKRECLFKRKKIVCQGISRDMQSILVTSCFAKDGKTIASVALSTRLCTHEDIKIVLVDGASRNPELHKVYEKPQGPGLMEAIYQGRDPLELVVATQRPNLFLLPNGNQDARQGTSIFYEQLEKVLARLKEEYDFIVFDGQSVMQNSEVILLCGIFDMILMVVACEKTKWEVLKLATDKLTSSGGNVLGIILNRRKFYIPRFLYGKI